jgi:hypothetical protein
MFGQIFVMPRRRFLLNEFRAERSFLCLDIDGVESRKASQTRVWDALILRKKL